MNDDRLSPDGEQRRHAILAMASAEARRVRAKRMFSRVVLAVLPIAVGSLLLRLQPAVVPVRPPMIAAVVRSSPPVVFQPSSLIQYVQTDPTITDRLTLPPVKPRWTAISDQELLDELAAAGQPAGIVCLNGKTMLLPR